MLRRTQIQAIADKLAGKEHSWLHASDLNEPWRTLYQRVQPVDDPKAAELALWVATSGWRNQQEVINAVLEALPSRRRLVCSLAALQGALPPIGWLWPGWIPRGFLTLLGGAPGAGKSLLALDLTRRILHGEPFPDGSPLPEREANRTQTRVLYVDAEAVPQVLNERAAAWGVDRSRLYVMMPPEAYGFLDLGCLEQQDELIDVVQNLKPELVVVDSLSSINLKGENNVEEVREVLGFLSALAREYRVGLLLIHHLRKRDRLAPAMQLVRADDFRGSSHIVARACSVLALSVVHSGPEPDPDSPRRLEVVKTNLAQYPHALGIRLEVGDGRVPELHYGEAPRPHRDATQAEECAGWLVALLEQAGGPMKPRDVVELAKKAGFSRGVLYRARRGLEGIVVDTEGRHHPDNRWALAEG